MRVSHDDQFLFSVGLDGSLLALRLTDKDGRGLKREKDIAFAEEVLVMKTDLEEKVNALYMLQYFSFMYKYNTERYMYILYINIQCKGVHVSCQYYKYTSSNILCFNVYLQNCLYIRTLVSNT